MTADEHLQFRRTGRLPSRFQYSAAHNAYIERSPANDHNGQVAIPRWIYLAQQLSGPLSSLGSSLSSVGDGSSWPSLPSFGDESSWPSLPSFGGESSWPSLPSLGDKSSWPSAPSFESLNGILGDFLGGGGGGGGKPNDAESGGGHDGGGQDDDRNTKETTVEQDEDGTFQDALPDLEVPTMYDMAKGVMQSDTAKDIIKMAIGFMPGGAPALQAYETGSKIFNTKPNIKIPGFK